MTPLLLPNRTTLKRSRAIAGSALLAGLCALVMAAGVQAASMRCDRAILRIGAHLYEVSEQCGEPVAEFQRVEYLQPNVVVYVDEWVYRQGRNKFQRLLRFENGRLHSIKTLRKPQVEPFRGTGSSARNAEYRISY